MKSWKALKHVFNAWIKKDAYSRFVLAEKLAGKIYPKYKFSEFGRIFLDDNDFLKYYESFQGTNNYHSLDRKYTLDQIMKGIIAIQGDTAECGTFECASSYLICRRIQGQNRKHNFVDSFQGLSAPGSYDGTYWKKGVLVSSESLTRKNLKEFDCVVYHPGWIPEKFSEVAHLHFAFVHLDIDLYQPTLDALTFFYQRIYPGGMILCDDYGFATCPCVKKAMDGFFSDKPEKIMRFPTGQALVIRRYA